LVFHETLVSASVVAFDVLLRRKTERLRKIRNKVNGWILNVQIYLKYFLYNFYVLQHGIFHN